MLPERLRRFMAALLCALSAGTMVFGASIVCGALDSQFESLIGERAKMPLVTERVLRLIPHDVEDFALVLFGTLGVTVGYGCLAWGHRVTALHAMLHAFLGLFATAVWAAFMPFILIVYGKEETRSAAEIWLERARFIPWLILCAAPLLMAAISWRKGKGLHSGT